MIAHDSARLASKYNRPVPRYTSYPTVPYWPVPFSADAWKEAVARQFNLTNASEGISLYIHLPFCEQLCTYCGCNKKITTNHGVEPEYLTVLEKEWQLYLDFLPGRPLIREIHLGGGTPTFFSPENLEWLMAMIFSTSDIHEQFEFSIEGHPNNTTAAHLESLSAMGFRRISYGVQDLDPEVQRIINRIQPLENVRRATEEARARGFTSVNYDLVYGLPRQSVEGLTRTVEEVIKLQPDRIAFYSYAHVPWTSRGQRLFDENDLPTAEEKLNLYLQGRALLTAAGYADIGMDHYARPGDPLYKAWQEGTLHRNFMGYTTQHTSLLLGLGVSSIGDADFAYGQNVKSIHEYYEIVNSGRLPIYRGMTLSAEDIVFKRHVLDICCKGRTTLHPEWQEVYARCTYPVLDELAEDGLVEWTPHEVRLTPTGRNFIRNVASAFDLYLAASRETPVEGGKPMFSKAI